MRLLRRKRREEITQSNGLFLEAPSLQTLFERLTPFQQEVITQRFFPPRQQIIDGIATAAIPDLLEGFVHAYAQAAHDADICFVGDPRKNQPAQAHKLREAFEDGLSSRLAGIPYFLDMYRKDYDLQKGRLRTPCSIAVFSALDLVVFEWMTLPAHNLNEQYRDTLYF